MPIIHRLFTTLSVCVWQLITLPYALADLQRPPSGSLPDGNRSWLDVIQDYFFKGLEILLLVGCVIGFLFLLAGLMNKYRAYTRNEIELIELGQSVGVSAIFAALLVALTYYGLQILQ